MEVKFDDGYSIADGLGSFIAGSNNSFTVFTESIAVDNEYNDTAKTVIVYSGTLSESGINNFYIAVFMVDNFGNPNGHWIDNGAGRVIKDSDGFSEIIATFRSSSINSNQANKGILER